MRKGKSGRKKCPYHLRSESKKVKVTEQNRVGPIPILARELAVCNKHASKLKALASAPDQEDAPTTVDVLRIKPRLTLI